MSKHDRGFNTLCVCSGCDGEGAIVTDDGREVCCPDCLGVGEVLVRLIDDDELHHVNGARSL